MAGFLNLQDILAHCIALKPLSVGQPYSYPGWLSHTLAWLVLVSVLASCQSARRAAAGETSVIGQVWRSLDVEKKYHAGFAVYDPANGHWLFNARGDNSFTPASNVKVLTLLTALTVLPDTLASAWYRKEEDSLVVWGSGDPGNWYPDYHGKNPLLDFIKSRPERVFLSSGHFRTNRYGAGWAWDDFPYAFQVERTCMPIHGNRLWIERTGSHCAIAPSTMAALVDIRSGERKRTGRSESGDRYWYTYDPREERDTVSIPIAFWGNDLVRTWSHYAGKTLYPSDATLPREAIPVKGSIRDTLLKTMMHESDNFIAEQLLLMAAVYSSGVMDERRIIDTMLRKPLAPVARDIRWVDGSGLSRYNLVTPRSMVWVLDEVLRLKGMDFIRTIFPAGGVSGTIADWYGGRNGVPYVFAKTGTLSNQHNLSGFLVTRRGRVLVFSWMNNQFPGPDNLVRKDMEKMLSAIHAAY